MTYNPDGLLDTVTDHFDRSVSYGYDTNGDLITVNDTRGLTWTYEYSGTSHLLHKVINPEGDIEEQTFYTTYDGLTRANLQLDGEGDTIASIQYSTDGTNEIRAINEGGRVYTDTYDSRNLLISQTDALGRSQDYTLDGNFNRTNTTDIRSQPTNYERTEVGLTKAITNALSQKTRFEFDNQNNLDLVIENDGTQTDYVYDAANNLRQIGTISGTIFYSYNGFGQVISTTNRRNHTTRYGYDQIGNLRVITNAVGNTTDFTYDNLGRVETVTNARDMVTRYQYDDGDNLRFITENYQIGACPVNECNLITEFQYDAAGRLEWVIDPANRRIKREYDNGGKVARVIVNYENGIFSNSAPDEDIITRYSYDTFGRLDATFETLAEGQERENRLIYDALNRLDSIIFNYVLGGSAPDQNLTTTYAYQDNTVPAIVTITDPTGLVTRTEYDALGRLEKRIVNYQAGACPATECNLTTSYQYDDVGNLTSMTNPQSLVTNYQYDPLHRLTGVIEDVGGLNINTGFRYDNEGNLTLVTPPNLSSGQAPTTVYRYDALNRLDEMENALGHLTDYQYDPVSNLDKIIKPDTQIIDYGYDLLNRLTAIDYPTGETDVAFGYNQVSQRTSMTDDTGQTTYGYDDLDRLTEVNDGNSQIIGYRYDARGNRTRLTYPDGRYLSHSYDDADRPETMTPSATWDEGSFEYAYVNNRLDTLTRPNGVVSEYDYDSANRLLAITHRATSNDLGRYSYQLDEVGNVKVVTETLVSAPSTAYPANNGQVVLEAEAGWLIDNGELSIDNWVTSTAQSGYAGAGYLQTAQDVDTLVQTNEITASPRAEFTVDVSSPDDYVVWVRGYPTNAAGDSLYVGVDEQWVTVTGFAPGEWSWANLSLDATPATLALTQSGPTAVSLAIREDGLRVDRLVVTTDTTFIPTGLGPAATVPTVISPTLTRTIVYTYDNMYRLTEADYSTGEFFEYSYDDNGNRLSQTTLTGTNVYTYDAANRLVEVDGQSYTWDDNGNLLDDGQRSYGYDTANRLTGVTEGSNSTTFKYNGDGDRYAQIVNSVQTDYVLDPVGLAQVLAETTNSQSNFYLPGLAQYNNNSWQYFLPDRLGSVRQLVDQVSTVQLTQSFDPFGNLLRQAGTSSISFGYTGEQVDSSGLVYLRARYYSPELGRFLTADSIIPDPTNSQAWNRYAYVNTENSAEVLEY